MGVRLRASAGLVAGCALAWLAACSRPATGVLPDPSASGAPTATSSGDRADDPPLDTSLVRTVGRRTKLDLRLADEIAQHMIPSVPGKKVVYLATPNASAGSELVAVVTERPSCASGRFRVVGTVRAVSGPGKGPNPEPYTEHYLDVDRWWCLGS